MFGKPEDDRKSAACAAGQHQDCHHQVGAIGIGIINRRSPEVRVILCGCSCHSGCPTASIDNCTARRWADTCTCLGVSERDRSRMSTGSEALDEAGERAEDYLEKREKALGAVRESADGKSGNEVRALIVTEFRARGLAVPDETSLDRMVVSVLHPGGAATSILRTSRALINAGIGLIRIRAILRGEHVNESADDGDPRGDGHS